MDAVDKTAALTGYEVKKENVTDMSFDLFGETQRMLTTTVEETLISGAGTEEQKSQSKQTQSSDGETAELTVYADRDFVYVSDGNNKVRFAADSDVAAQFLPDTGFRKNEKDPSADVFKDMTVTENADGTVTCVIRLTPEQFSELLGEDMLSALSGAEPGSGVEIEDLTCSDITATFVLLQSGYVGSYTVKMHVDMVMSMGLKINVSSEFTGTTTYVDPGKDVTVTFPDLSDYEEYVPEEPADPADL